MSTRFPTNIDNDTTLPRVDDNITEIGGEAINGLKDAVTMIETVVGISPQGNKASLTDRVNVAIDADGNLKTSALSGKGLVTLPINNSHVSSSAAIEETKLDLDYSTASLKNSINSLSATIASAQSGVGSLSNSFNSHIYGLDHFHDGYAVRINSVASTQTGIAGLNATSIGEAVVELGSLLLSGDGSSTPHIDLNLPSTTKHTSADISVDASGFEIIDSSVSTVQEAFDSLDEKQGSFIAGHLDTFHSNGILKELKSGDLYNANQQKIDSWTASYTLGSSVVTIPDVTLFSTLNIETGDILEVENTTYADYGTHQVRAIGPLTAAQTLGDLPVLAANQLAVFHVFAETKAAATVSVYKPETVSSESAPLACAIRHNETIVDAVTILNPNAARVVSLGFNSAIINGDGYDLCVEVGLDNGAVRSLLITDLNQENLGTSQADPVDAKSVAERINAFVSDPTLGHHFPISAFRVGNEIAIAHNLVGSQYTLKILDGYTGNYALGLDSHGADVLDKTIKGNENNSFVVGGVELDSIKTVLAAFVSITTDTSTLTIRDANGTVLNPLKYGIKAGSVMHVIKHPLLDVNGSYTLLTSDSTTVSTFVAEPILALTNPTTFEVLFTDSHVTLEDFSGAETDQGVIQIAINSLGEVQLHDRLTYGTSLGSSIEIIDVSETLPDGTYTLSLSTVGYLIDFNFIDDTALSGDTITVHKDFSGTFKLYHSNNIDYIVVRVIETIAGLSGGNETVVVKNPVIYDESMVLGNVHFNGSLAATNVFDTRLFGNLGEDQIRDDFIEVFSQRPIDELRSNGVVRGFDVLGLTMVDAETNMQALPLSGGVAYIGGVRVAVKTQKVVIQSYTGEGSLIGSTTRIIGINEFGTIRAFSDPLSDMLVDGYESSGAFGKILPLYRVSLNSIGAISTYTDLRLFVNRLDDKLDFSVDSSTFNSIGTFKTLDGAIDYINNYSGLEKSILKVVGNIICSVAITVPNGISLVGQSPYGGFGKQSIRNSGCQGDFITLAGNNKLENIEITCSDSTLYGALVKANGQNIEIHKCRFGFDYTVTTQSNNWAIEVNSLDYITITDNIIENCFSGIVVVTGCNNLVIEGNTINGLMGTATSAYGIRVATVDRSSNLTSIIGNKINIPSVANPSDIFGISVNINNTIYNLRICDNNILHTPQNAVGCGIMVTNEGVTGNTAKQTLISGNSINGIKLNDNNVWGIYVGSCANLIIATNNICNVGVATNTNVGGIGITTGVLYAEIADNMLIDFAATRGIDISNTSAKVKISGNELVNIGTSAYYINGNAPYSIVSDNKLIGPGSYGIVWTGTYSKILGNKLNKPGDLGLTDYAFSTYGIYVNVADVDIEENTILGMAYDENSIGISNVATTRTNIRITNNTISGTLMSKLISLFGAGHMVSNNRLSNTAKSTGGTNYINLTTVSNSLISNNLMQGAGTYGISSGTTTTTGVSIVNNDITATSLTKALDLYGNVAGSTTQCLVMGNKLPYGGTGMAAESTIGITPASGVYNTNTIGANAGLLDTRSVPACDFLTAYDTNNSIYGWRQRDTNTYWTPISPAVNFVRYLYMPITDLPNGAQITSVDLFGANVDGTWAGTLYKFSNTTYAASAISAALPIAITPGNFTKNIPTTSGAEIVNYQESSYFLQIVLSGVVTEVTNIVYGGRINYRY